MKKGLINYLATGVAIFSLSGCAAVGAATGVAQAAKSTLEALGLKKPDTPEVPDAMKQPRTVPIKLHASKALNLDPQQRPLALVVKIYKLKQNISFQQASYDTFLSAQKEKEALGADLLEVKEVTLVPGQRYEISEKVSYEAGYIGVVALFVNPAQQRWRAVFKADEAEKNGITVGLQSCSLTVGAGAVAIDAQGKPLEKNLMLAPVQCH
ncbi:type VI secretion system lipoprotein TssJ [Herbaspirillum sp. DW155]|uniref:type VI secretion system lipoprotein TssJ n=1 Tax=Herbaspirillum sp. DW155 TaxID=3095609 RepID=UPI003085504C|nr:type VI secretion system lipoprotein TssJ [Herbaspirillum sp. DW155]